MAGLENTLARIPGLAGYLGTEEFTQNQQAGQLSNAQRAMTLRDHFIAQEREKRARDAMASLSPDASNEERVAAMLPFVTPDTGLKALGGRATREAALAQTGYYKQMAADLAAQAEERRRRQANNALPPDQQIPGAAPQQGVFNLGGRSGVIPNNISDEEAVALWKASGGAQNPVAPGQAIPPQAAPAVAPVGAPVARGEAPAPAEAAAPGAPVARGQFEPPPEVAALQPGESRKDQQKRIADWRKEAIKQHFKLQNAAQLSPEALKVAGWEKLLFGTDPKGFGTASAQQRAQVMDERARIGKALGLSEQEMAMLPFDAKVKQKAMGNLVQWGAFVGKAQEQLEKSMDLAIDYAKKLSPTTLQTINRAIIAGRKEFNDPIANAYALQIQTVRTEYGRLMAGPTSNGMLPVEALKKGDDLLSKGADVPSLMEMRKVMTRDAKITKDSVDNQVNGLRSSIANPSALANKKEAPEAALSFLKANPTQAMKEAFKAKYGYLPDGL